MWTNLDSETTIEQFLNDFAGFHDACLREVSIATETYVNENLGMSCPGHLDTSVRLFFQSQISDLSAIEIMCKCVSGFRLKPTPDNCDSIISTGTIAFDGNFYRLAAYFIGGPLTGPPDSSVEIPSREDGPPDLEVIAQEMAWRPLAHSLGPQLRYRPDE